MDHSYTRSSREEQSGRQSEQLDATYERTRAQMNLFEYFFIHYMSSYSSPRYFFRSNLVYEKNIMTR